MADDCLSTSLLEFELLNVGSEKSIWRNVQVCGSHFAASASDRVSINPTEIYHEEFREDCWRPANPNRRRTVSSLVADQVRFPLLWRVCDITELHLNSSALHRWKYCEEYPGSCRVGHDQIRRSHGGRPENTSA